jgi:hypothetical protein
MPLVSNPSAFACRAERLAGARSCPNFSIVWPPSSAQGKGPDPDAGEEMALCEFSKLIWMYVFNASFINNSIGNETGFD